MYLIRKLFTPLKYLKIYHKQKFLVDFWAPVIVSVFLVGLLAFLPADVDILGSQGVLNRVNGLLQILSGFYVAALAAIASFNSENLDSLLGGLGVKLNGRQLTRRQFLSYLFGYLAFISYTLVLLGIGIGIFLPNIELVVTAVKSQNLIMWIKYIFLTIYFTILCSMFFTTLLGLYYLTEKIHEDRTEFVKRD